MELLGIDVGGSGIKGALVDTESGDLITERIRIKTPQPSNPEAVIGTILELVKQFEYKGPLGVGFPAVVLDGVVMSAANVDSRWINYPGIEGISKAVGYPVALVNDADAAGIAEMTFGAGKGRMGMVMVLTLGTGIGSALFVDGKLVPNTELGHLYLPNSKEDAEDYTSDRIRMQKKLTWKVWASRLDTYLHHIEGLFSPNLIILGGGVSKKHNKFIPRLTVRTEIVPAELLNEAGIVGAALAAKPLA
ncbi:MAG TPA: ROK family protein [candidate division Zixibacteria bacterium]|nr:ROK family protein [candidate division Zixibacteria bacterium]